MAQIMWPDSNRMLKKSAAGLVAWFGGFTYENNPLRVSAC